MSRDDYTSAKRLGQKQYHAAVSAGKYPYLQALDDILSYTEVQREVSLGLLDIPLEMIAGTKTSGRQNAFSCGFMAGTTQREICSMKRCSLAVS